MSYVREFAQQVKVYDTGFTKIRVGRDGDGGYVLLHEVIPLADELFSYGIGDDVSFELDLVRRYEQIKWASLFDPAIVSLPQRHPVFQFYRKPADASVSLPMNAIVKMDIEGSEWDVLHLMDLEPASQFIVEFHLVHADPPPASPYFTQWFRRMFYPENALRFKKYAGILAALNRDFYCFHAHINNSLPIWKGDGHAFPLLLEMSFVRKDLCYKPVTRNPKPLLGVKGLDYPNKTDRPDRWWDYETMEGGDIA